MGERLTNIAKLFKDARTRTIILMTGGVLLFGIVIGIYLFNKLSATPPTQATVARTPAIESVPGSFSPSPEYVKLQEQENISRAKEASQTGQSAIPTIIRATQPGTGEFAGTATAEQPWQAGLGFQQLAQVGPTHAPKELALDKLKNKCDPEDVKKAVQLGASVQELMSMGCVPEQLLKAGINICDLCVIPQAPYVPGLPVGVTAQQLKAAGCDPAALAKAKAQGVTAAALKAIGCNVVELKAGGYSAMELKAAGFPPGELKAAGFLAEELKRAGFSAAELKAAGFTASELKDAGFSAQDLKNAGYSAGELIKAGFAPKQLKDAGYSAIDLAQAGLTPEQLKDTGFSEDIVKEAITKANQGLPPGVTLEALKAGDCTPEAIKQAKEKGVSAEILKKLGCTPTQLKVGGNYTAAELKAAGFNAGELKLAGFSAQDLKNAGFMLGELRTAGFSATQLKAAGFTPEELKNAGFSAGELARAGFTAQQLKQAGLTSTELKSAGFSAKALKAAGFSAENLKQAGFSINELANADFSAADLKQAGFSSDAIAKAGFSQQELLAAGITTPKLEPVVSPPAPAPVPTPPAPITEGQSTPLQEATTAQQRQIDEQQLQNKMQQLQAAIQGQAGQLFAAWKTPIQAYMEGTPPSEQETAAQAGVGMTGGRRAVVAAKAPAWVKAGTIKFAVLITSVNSDEPGPVLAKIVSDGEFKDARLIGRLTTFPPHGQKIMLMFDTMTLPNYSNSIPINAVAIDENTARTAVSSFTNNHYISRFGSLFASSFLQGYGQAFLQSGQRIISIPSSTTVTSPDLSPRGKLMVALGAVGNRFAQQLNQYFNVPPTVHVFSGTGVGILFLSDLPPPSPQQ